MADTLPAKNDISKDNNNDGRRHQRTGTGKPIIVVVGAGSKHINNNATTENNSDNSNGNDDDDVARWGLGGALAVPFAEEGYNIVLMGRRKEVLDEEEEDEQQQQPQPKVLSVRCDVTDDNSVEQAFQEVSNNVGTLFPPDSYIDLIIFNVAPPYPSNFKFEGWGDVLQPHQIDTDNMTFQFDTQINGLIRVCKQATMVPAMIERKRGCILLSGESCCNLHGGFEFGAVAPARAALRSLAQSMFQAYGPLGIHVCNINIGGIIDSPKTRTWMDKQKLTNPYEIARQFLNAYQQPSTVWSYEIMLSPGFAARTVDMRM
ncbi:NAD(P)-binding protein [Fragilariopsis cylindrus CCMP1102]|uniref:NAD(P)-binding protein n=1 Tax=Fragilariopsis cylindrus CCMP1102 TaxID=635003 RepID=A0A1E7FFS9_9STRA|nr:NAD(P)-binding protein [Fragilariopsis cylindrus CCMP1102]|eukprot:OEU17004.1 NAD(P)-binding protein [Fragilariopsis cylindrus CCMP1102]